jgi:hypothetical protein
MTTIASTCGICHRALFSDGTCPVNHDRKARSPEELHEAALALQDLLRQQAKPKRSTVPQCHAGGFAPIKEIPQDLEDEALESLRMFFAEILDPDLIENLEDEALESLRMYYEEMIKKENGNDVNI